jgi:hypothetical protein
MIYQNQASNLFGSGNGRDTHPSEPLKVFWKKLG